jgi:hypothetical protein
MAYFVTAVFVLIGGVALGLILLARHESRLVPRPSLISARRIARRPRVVTAGDQCVCGGVLGPSGRDSEKFGPLLGCTGCSRTWTMSGRRFVRRSRPLHPDSDRR